MRKLTLSLVMALACSAAAEANILTNGSFEEPGDSHKIGWTITGRFGVSKSGQSDYNGGASHGEWGAIGNSGQQAPDGVLSQTFATTAGTTYVLTFDIGKYSNGSGDARVDILITGLGTLLNATAKDSTGVGGFRDPLEYADFEHVQFMFTADSASTTLQLTDTSTNNGSNFDLVLDNFVVTAAVPEPASLTLAATGLLLLARRRR